VFNSFEQVPPDCIATPEKIIATPEKIVEVAECSRGIERPRDQASS